MEPVSIISLVGSVVSIVDVIGRSLSYLLDLQTKYRKANLTISLLIGQLSTLKAALNQISEWITASLVGVPQHEQLVADLDVSIEACKILILVLDDRISCLERGAISELRTVDKVQFLWEEKGMTDYLNHLNNQINALNLLLTALQCRSLFEQRQLLQTDESRHIIRMIKDDTSSLLWVRDTEAYSCYTRKSVLTENSVMLDTVFDFDCEIFHSRAYQVAARSNMKQALKNRNRTDVHNDVTPSTNEFGLPSFMQSDDGDQDVQTIKETIKGEPPDRSQPMYDTGADNLDDIPKDKSSHLVPSATRGAINFFKPGIILPDGGPVTDIGNLRPLELPPLSQTNFIASDHNLEKLAGGKKQARRRPWSLSNVLKSRAVLSHAIQQAREKAQAATMGRVEREGRERNKEIEKQIMRDRARDKVPNVLLLGALESGKSTLLMSIKLLLEGPYSLGELESFKKTIFSNIFWSMRVILEAMESLEISVDDKKTEDLVMTIYQQPTSMQVESLPPRVTAAIKGLWKDAGVLECFKRSREYQLNDSAEYYFNSASRIGQSQYVPIEQDVLRSRVKTTGITATTFVTENGIPINVFDVGGTRSERKKWIHCFENVHAIIFCVDISAYDRLLFEDETVNRMKEALVLFDSICNSRWFVKKDIILHFTKVDLLEAKLAHSPIRFYFPEYIGDSTDLRAVKDYICERFLALNQNPGKVIRVHYVDLLDERQYAMSALDSINDCIIQRELN